MDDVLNTPASIKQSDSGTPKPMKQNASVGVNMDEEEGLTGGGAMSASHLTPLGVNQAVSMGDSQLIVPANNQLGGGGVSVSIMSASGGGGQMVMGTGGQMVVGSGVGGDQVGAISASGGQIDVTGGMQQVQVGRGAVAVPPNNPHHIAMDSSGMCYATASISQPLTTFVNGQQQQEVMPGVSAMIQGRHTHSHTHTHTPNSHSHTLSLLCQLYYVNLP